MIYYIYKATEKKSQKRKQRKAQYVTRLLGQRV